MFLCLSFHYRRYPNTDTYTQSTLHIVCLKDLILCDIKNSKNTGKQYISYSHQVRLFNAHK